MKPNSISIVIPVYNAEEYLDQCIQSVLRQTIRNIELILVDDGSKDNSLAVCQKYIGSSDIPVKVLKQKNLGSSIARKNGVLAATGDYIGFIDADDYVKNNMYESMMKKAEEFDADMVVCGISYLRGEKENPYCSKIPAGVYTLERLQWLKENACMDGCQSANRVIAPSLCNKIVKRKIVMTHMEDITSRLTMGDDWAVAYPCLWDASVLVLIPECYYVYRYNEEGITKSYNNHMWYDLKELFDTAMYTKNKYAYQMDDYYQSYFQYIILLCLINETRTVEEQHYFELRNRIKEVLHGQVCKYAFKDMVAKRSTKLMNVLSFCVKHKLFDILTALLMILRRKQQTSRKGCAHEQ